MGSPAVPTQLQSGEMSWAKRAIGAVALAGVAAAPAAPAAGAGAGGAGQVRLAQAARLQPRGSVVGAVAAEARMHVTVVLKPSRPAALASFARAVSDPASAHYRAYLTPAQFGRRFGASAAELTAVEGSLRAHGLAPGKVPADRLSVPITASAGQVEAAFSLRLSRVRLPGGRRAVLASAAPAIDRAIAPGVQAVLGLSSLGAPHPLFVRPRAARAASAPRVSRHVATGGPQPCAAASQASQQQGAYTADQIASAYRMPGLYGAGDQGQGVTIAMYELELNDPADIAAYQACYGTHASVGYVSVDGGPGGAPQGSGEAALDIENAIGLAPRAGYLVYQGPNANQDTPGSGPYDTFSAIVNQARAQVISVSWGECEQLEGTSGAKAESTLFEQAAAQGQSIVSAAGDEGSEDCNGTAGVPDPELAVDDPSSQPFVTGVGGTSTSQIGPPPSQSVWNNGGNLTGLVGIQPGAGGGGISALWGMPGYQARAAGALHVVNSRSSASTCGSSGGDCRQVPDVSADADPNTGYLIYFNGAGDDPTSPSGWQAVGGTSGAAPVWAAVLALIDASAACHGSPVGFANPALYAAAAANYAGTFDDVTAGNNDFTGTNGGQYPAGGGYDMASGLGTPNAAGLAGALCADSLRIRDPGAQTAIAGQPVSLQLATTGRLDGSATWVSSGLPPGLSLSRSTGRITGRPARRGDFSAAVVVLDQALSIRGVALRWVVLASPRVSGVTLTGTGEGRPRLGLTVRAGQGAPGLGRLVLSLPGGLAFHHGRVRVTGAGGHRIRFTAHPAGRRLAISLTGAPRTARLTVAFPAIVTSQPLSARIRRHQGGSLTLGLTVTDVQRHRISLAVRIRPRG